MTRALLLAGGTALGADQIYTMEQLMSRHGLDAYGAVAGVSVGSVNGSMFSANKLPQLRQIWESITGRSDFMELNLFGKPGLTSLEPLRRLLKHNIRQSEISSSLRFTVGVTDFQEDKYIDIPSSSFSDNEAFLTGIVASASQPVLMEGWRTEVPPSGERHWCFDGGVRHVIPRLQEPSAFSDIDVILCNPPLRLSSLEDGDLDGLFEVMDRAFNIMANQNVLISDVQRLLAWGQAGSNVTIYAPREHDDEFAADHEIIMERLNVIGKWMWENPWSPQSFLDHWAAS